MLTVANSFLLKNKKGMTLLEILVALTIVVGVLGISAGFVKKKENQTKATFRKLIALNRQLDNYSRLRRKTYRLVIEMKEEEDSWWVESEQPVEKEDETSSDIAEETFTMDKEFFEKPQKLPRPLRFSGIESAEQKEVIKKGQAYIYYFPEGQFNLTLINIKGSRQTWSLLINRLRGNMTVFTEEKKLADFKQ